MCLVKIEYFTIDMYNWNQQSCGGVVHTSKVNYINMTYYNVLYYSRSTP